MQTVAAVTMVRDDAFFLKAWLRHYGEMFGRENCYVINHGRGAEAAALAAGCNIIGIPGDPHKNFDVKRWGLLNNLVGGLRRYYRHVIVGDVDELVIRDPEAEGDLLSFLEAAPEGRVLTPLGLEVIDVRLKQTNLPDQNLDATFARMRAEREREATDERARGEEAAQRVRAQADRTVVELTSEVSPVDSDRYRVFFKNEKNKELVIKKLELDENTRFIDQDKILEYPNVTFRCVKNVYSRF